MVAGSSIVRVVYHTHYHVENPSHVLCVAGSSPYLGKWRPELALTLHRDDVAGWWSGEVAIPPGESFEWKLFVRDNITGHVIREEERETRYLNIISGNIMFHVFAYWKYHELFANVYGVDCAESWAFPDVRNRYTKRPKCSMATAYDVKVIQLTHQHNDKAQDMNATVTDATAQYIEPKIVDTTNIPAAEKCTTDSDHRTKSFSPSTQSEGQGEGQSKWRLSQIKLPWFGSYTEMDDLGSDVDSLITADVDYSQTSCGSKVAMIAAVGVVGLVLTGLYLKRRL